MECRLCLSAQPGNRMIIQQSPKSWTWSPGIDSKESIPPAYAASCLADRYVKKGCRTGPPGWEPIAELLKSFTNTSSVSGQLFKDDVNRFSSISEICINNKKHI